MLNEVMSGTSSLRSEQLLGGLGLRVIQSKSEAGEDLADAKMEVKMEMEQPEEEEEVFSAYKESLKEDLHSKMYSVLRSGEVAEVCERSLVVGDVIILKYGDKIPTDGILLRSSELRVDESVS